MDPVRVGGVEITRHSAKILHLHWSGEMAMPEYEALLAFAEAMLAQIEDESLCLFATVDGEVKFAPKVRASMIELARQHIFERTAIVHAPRRVRVLIELIANAVRVMVRSQIGTRFFDDEAEALAWLESA